MEEIMQAIMAQYMQPRSVKVDEMAPPAGSSQSPMNVQQAGEDVGSSIMGIQDLKNLADIIAMQKDDPFKHL